MAPNLSAALPNERPSNARFRSFAERYVCARAEFFRVPPKEHMEDQWLCIQDARRAYDMIKQTGRNILDDS